MQPVRRLSRNRAKQVRISCLRMLALQKNAAMSPATCHGRTLPGPGEIESLSGGRSAVVPMVVMPVVVVPMVAAAALDHASAHAGEHKQGKEDVEKFLTHHGTPAFSIGTDRPRRERTK